MHNKPPLIPVPRAGGEREGRVPGARAVEEGLRDEDRG